MRTHPAWLFVQVHLWSLKNRTLARLRRLRQVKYVLFTAVGLAYLFGVWRPWRTVRFADDLWSNSMPPWLLPAVGAGVALFFTLFALLSWAWPRSRPALEFTETEIAFLFPAPLTRRQVIDYSLLKSQVGVMFSSLMISFFGLRHAAPSFLFAWIGVWIAFSTLQLHVMASGIVRANLLRHGRAGLRHARGFLLLLGALAAMVAAWALFWLRPPAAAEMDDPARLAAYLAEMSAAGPMAILLWPGRALSGMILAPSWAGFLTSAPQALALLAAHYAWVIRSDFAYEEASAERAARKASEISAATSGRRRRRLPSLRRRRPPFPLAPRGRPEVALLWKNLIAAGRIFSLGNLAVAAPLLCLAAWGAKRLATGTPAGGILAALGFQAWIFAALLLLLGPTLFRSDLRADLLNVSILKTLPLSGPGLVLGEVLAPAALVTVLQALLLGLGFALVGQPDGWSAADLAAVAAAFLIQAAPLNVLSALIQNGAVLLFPSWHALGPERARGFEALGQRLLSSLLFLVALAAAYLPAGAIFAFGLLLARPRFGWLAAPPLALLAALPAALEAAFGVLLVGWLFERFDPSKELDTAQ